MSADGGAASAVERWIKNGDVEVATLHWRNRTMHRLVAPAAAAQLLRLQEGIGGDKDERRIFETQQSINKSKLTNKSATCNPTGVKAAPSPETIVLAYLALKSVR